MNFEQIYYDYNKGTKFKFLLKCSKENFTVVLYLNSNLAVKKLNELYVQPGCLQNNVEVCLLLTRLCHVHYELKSKIKFKLWKINDVPSSISVVSSTVCLISFYNLF